MNLHRFRSNSPRSLGRARVAVVVTAVTALAGAVIVAPAAFGAAPDAPGQPTATAGDGQISVAFTAPPGATGFAATCASSDGGATGSATGTASPLAVTSVTNGKTYTCAVIATNVDGPSAASPASNPVTPSGVPGTPDAPVATAANGSISVAFTTPPTNGSPISNVAATCSSPNGGVTTTDNGTISPISVGPVTNGDSYTCTVTATNGNGPGPTSGVSNSVTPAAPATVPGTPGTPVAVAGDAQASLTFSLASPGSSPIIRYTATCTSVNDSSTFVNKTGTTSPINNIPLFNGVTYSCTVTATNANGDGPASAPSNAVTPAAASAVPGAPRNVSASASDSQILVSFAAPLSPGSSYITGYTANCSSSNGGTAGQGSGGGSPIIVGSLDDGSSYTCTVFASNGVGNGAPSTASGPVTPHGVPSAPAKPTVAGGDTRITVTFNAPASNGGSAITRYTATCTSFTTFVSTSAFATTATPITVPNLNNGDTYNCVVTAANAFGPSNQSPSSDPVVPDRGPDTPAAPAVLAGNAQISVSFTAPGTGGSPITGYAARCASTNGGLTGTGTASGTATSILVTGVTNGRGYRCTVTAKNLKGSSLASAASALVIPSTVPSAPPTPGVTPGNGSISVSFRAPGNGGTAITSYVTSCSSSNGGHAGSEAGTTAPLVVTGLTNEKSYRCTVTARNARGTGAASPVSAITIPSSLLTIQSTQRGFRLFAGDGGVFAFGIDKSFGSAAGVATHTVVGMTSTLDTKGYWLVATDGGIFSFGNAHFWGSTGAMHLNQPIVGMATTPSGHGYWLVASDGGIFSFGDAHFWGSTGAIRLNQPIVGMASTPTGHGYWLVASDGGLFSFGDARFYGAPTGRTHSPVVGMASTPRGGGYWIAAADGSVYNFGNAPAYGGVTVRATRLPIAGIASTPTGHGYWLAAGDGGVFTFGDAPFIGWPGPLVLRQPIRGVNR